MKLSPVRDLLIYVVSMLFSERLQGDMKLDDTITTTRMPRMNVYSNQNSVTRDLQHIELPQRKHRDERICEIIWEAISRENFVVDAI